MLKFKEFVDRAPNYVGKIRLDHGFGCEGSSKSLLIERRKDGGISARCFRCGKSGFYDQDVVRVRRNEIQSNQNTNSNSNTDRRVLLPGQIETNPALFPMEAKSWIFQYGIKPTEIIANGIVYDIKNKRIILPVLYDRELLGYISRKIYNTDPKPKYLTYGFYKNRIGKYLPKKDCKTIVIVEDILSGIKCFRYVSSYSMLGTYIPTSMCNYIINNYNKVIIYLDNDNSKIKSIQYKIYLFFDMFMDTILIKNDKDPKELTDEQLKEILCQ